jgi:hypothetical protein
VKPWRALATLLLLSIIAGASFAGGVAFERDTQAKLRALGLTEMAWMHWYLSRPLPNVVFKA